MRRPVFFFLALMVFVLDQFTKRWVTQSLSEYSHIPLIPELLYLTQTTNTGAAFGVFQHGTVLLALAAFGAIASVLYYASKTHWPIPTLLGTGLALPLGGAFGNFLDRVRLGHVVDFIEVRLGSYTWPIFNIADSAICVGVALLALAALRSQPVVENSTKETQPLS
jgi:signal peptidase II